MKITAANISLGPESSLHAKHNKTCMKDSDCLRIYLTLLFVLFESREQVQMCMFQTPLPQSVGDLGEFYTSVTRFLYAWATLMNACDSDENNDDVTA